MTREELEQMPAGREMDALIAERVMDYKLIDGPESLEVGKMMYYTPDQIPAFSTNIGAAWLVAEKMNRDYFTLEIHSSVLSGAGVRFWGPNSGPTYSATAETVPLAICRAALIAVMESER